MKPKAVVLLSGGMDSATCLHLAKAEGMAVYALSVRYGQRHVVELKAAATLARRLPVVEHLVLDLDLARMGGSALTSDAVPVPKDGVAVGVPVTYVPARNTVLLSLALAWAETLDAHEIWIGVNVVDYSGYPDCRPEFVEAFERLANVGTRDGAMGRTFRIRAPLMSLGKPEIVRMGLALGVDYGLTQSCYDPDREGLACGGCDACRLRLAGFAALELSDPARYRRE